MSGLFEDETIITVAANTVQLLELKDIPNTVTNSTVESVLTSRDIPLNILDDLVLGSNTKTNTFYRYGKNRYHYGLPSGRLFVTGVDNQAVRAHLEAIEGVPVEVLRVDIDHETGDMQLGSWLVSTYNFNPVTLLITTYPSAVTNGLNSLSNDAVNNYNLVISGIRSNINNEFNGTTVATVVNGNLTTTTTTTRVSTITESLVSDEERNAYLEDMGNTSNPTYSSVRRLSFFRQDASRTAEYAYDVWYILNRSFETTFNIQCEETVITETSLDNGDGTFTTTSNTETNNFNTVRNHLYEFEDTGMWTGTKVETWTVTFTTVIDADGNSTRTVATNTQFALYYSINNGSRIKFRLRSYATYKDQFIRSNTSNIGGQYYPIVPLRRNNQDMTRTSVRGGNAYITSKRLMNRLGISLLDISKAINENPGVNDIDHSYFMMGVPINATDPAAARYFFEFFEEIYNVRQATPTPVSSVPNLEGGFGLTSLLWRKGYTGNLFSIEDAGLKIEIGFGSISIETKIGSVTKKGKATINHVATKGTTIGATGVGVTNYTGTMTIRKQITVNTYQEMKVTNLRYKNYVYQNHTVDVTYYDAVNGGDENFIIPLFRPAVMKMSLIQRDRLLYMAPHLVMNSYQVDKVKWYQSGFFGFLIQVAAFAYAIYTMNPAAFAAAGSISAVAWMLIKKILISFAFSFAFRLVAKVLGEEFALLMALALAAYGMMQYGSGSKTFFDMPDSEFFMKASTSLIQGVQTNIQKEFENLVDTANLFAKDMQTKMEELEAINKEMDPSNIIDPFMFLNSMQPYTRWGESPDDYFNRTVHAGNPASESIEMVSKYVDIMLKLPEIEDTIVEDEETEYEWQ